MTNAKCGHVGSKSWFHEPHIKKGEVCNSLLGVHLAAGKTRVTNGKLITDWVDSNLVGRAGVSAGSGTWPEQLMLRVVGHANETNQESRWEELTRQGVN